MADSKTLRVTQRWIRLVDVAVFAGLCKTKAEAKRLIQQGGLHVLAAGGEITVQDIHAVITCDAELLHQEKSG